MMAEKKLFVHKVTMVSGDCLAIPPGCLVAVRAANGGKVCMVRQLFSVSTPGVAESLEALVSCAPDGKGPRPSLEAVHVEAAKDSA
eukprot:39405-Amphidinium_carterae.1